jgi:hypothetical protein
MKKIILTMDYELFLGEKTGTVKKCMIEPTAKLISCLKKNNSMMTVFWDILHYYRLIELGQYYSELQKDKLLIEEQILELVYNGHDIQLHLHPQWLDAKYEDGRWKFIYDRYKLHNLLCENNVDDINTILGCISISKNLIESLIRKVNPDYKVTTFRAGGYLIEPFNKLKDALLSNGIYIDSSISPGIYNNDGLYSYDYRDYPLVQRYNFSITPKSIVEDGNFIEIPITSIKYPLYRNIYFMLLARIKYSNLNAARPGTPAGKNINNSSINKIRKLLSIFYAPQMVQLTLDAKFREKFNYLINKAPEYSTMIMHPKLLNSHMLGVLNHYVKTQKAQFISIKDFINKN